MFYQDTIGTRYPKGSFAMVAVYSLTAASILASTVFSLLLFLSIDDNPTMKWLFGALAVIFEAGKFYAWYEYGERRAHRNLTGALSALIFYLVLAVISIGGSIGGINSATNASHEQIAVEQAKVNAYNRQIAAIDEQIALNNLAAEKFIEMERITYGVSRIQSENKDLRKEQQRLAAERDSLPPVAQGSIIGLIDSLAKLLNIDSSSAQLGLVVFLSILLDFFAAFFVGVIGEELRFRHHWRHRQTMTIDVVPVTDGGYAAALPLIEAEPLPVDAEPSEVVEPNETAEPSLRDQIAVALDSGQLTCSKSAVARKFGLKREEVNQIFQLFMEEGLLDRKANQHFRWIG